MGQKSDLLLRIKKVKPYQLLPLVRDVLTLLIVNGMPDDPAEELPESPAAELPLCPAEESAAGGSVSPVLLTEQVLSPPATAPELEVPPEVPLAPAAVL